MSPQTMDTYPGSKWTIPNDYGYYLPLDPAQNEIRLLLLQPRSERSDICCTLLHGSLAGELIPAYECLSYCWGDLSDIREITLEHSCSLGGIYQQKYKVTANLAAALWHLRLEDQNRVLWIDAICVDQSNLAERAHQIGYMGEIFRLAKEVTAWLGEDDTGAKLAMCFMPVLARKYGELNSVSIESLVDPMGIRIDGPIDHALFSFDPHLESDEYQEAASKMVEALVTFFSRSYFRRVWVLQEVMNATRVSIQCGDTILPWGCVVLAAKWHQAKMFEHKRGLSPSGPLMAPYHLPDLWISISETANRQRMRLLTLLFEAREFEATDPRDKLFALLALAKETAVAKHIPPEIRPDYRKTKVQVFSDLTRCLILKQGSLEILSAVDTLSSNQDLEEPIFLDQPSWVPTLEGGIGTWCLFGLHGRYRAAGDTVPVLVDNPDPTCILSLLGVRIDTINFITSDTFDIDSKYNLWIGGEPNAIFSIWKEVVRKLWPYPTGDDLLAAYIRTLTCLCYVNVPGSANMRSLSLLEAIEDQGAGSIGFYTLANFAAHWHFYFEPGMDSLPAKHREYLLELSRSEKPEQYPPGIFGQATRNSCLYRRFFTTADGYMGLCPRLSQVGDLVVMLYGGSVPYVLRPKRSSSHNYWTESPAFEFVGECYLHGRMDGSMIDEQRHYHIPPEKCHLR